MEKKEQNANELGVAGITPPVSGSRSLPTVGELRLPPNATLTDGEWYARKSPSIYTADVWEVCWSPDAECVAETVHGEANARLFAASKELFVAAQKVSQRMITLDSGDAEAMRELEAAIAKALTP